MPLAIYMYKIIKNVYKSDFEEIILKLANQLYDLINVL